MAEPKQRRIREYDCGWTVPTDKPWDQCNDAEKWRQLWAMVREPGKKRGDALRKMNELFADHIRRPDEPLPDEALALLYVLTDPKCTIMDARFEVKKKRYDAHAGRQGDEFKNAKEIQSEMVRSGSTREEAIKRLYPDPDRAKAQRKKFKLPYPRKLWDPWDEVTMNVRESK